MVDLENLTAKVEGGDWEWVGEVGLFGKAPEGVRRLSFPFLRSSFFRSKRRRPIGLADVLHKQAFEDALPSDLTRLRLSLISSSLLLTAPSPSLSSQLALSVSLLTLSSSLTPDAPRTSLDVGVEGVRAWAVDSAEDLTKEGEGGGFGGRDEREFWKGRGFVELGVVERASVAVGLMNGGGGGGGKGPETEVRFRCFFPFQLFS